ncbi:hypothetical protein SJ05684_c22380 [Sinorhizobium sojae CCBAU 05684]|uniref:Uncharacterized protein n=1 Tax=Sinorhizobium sojae CCBAU 05684 TaxID=716928 RepID=A0A249PEJ9_9HYPH|nr:hypothetical protein SJ05684_c22380 [Sinorhizobium sojae CCBAU 05684]
MRGAQRYLHVLRFKENACGNSKCSSKLCAADKTRGAVESIRRYHECDAKAKHSIFERNGTG